MFVTTGPVRGDQVAVLKGVKEGDQVVTTGQLKLFNGALDGGRQQYSSGQRSEPDAPGKVSQTQKGRPMNFTDIFIRRPVAAAVVSLLILVLGLRSLSSLPVNQYPKTQNATVTICDHLLRC